MDIDKILAFVVIAVLLITVGIQTIKLRHSKGTIRKEAKDQSLHT